MQMIVIGADTHKRSHTCAAAKSGTGEVAGEKTAPARKPGFRELLDWGRDLDRERIWALEDCRHVSGSFERFLVDHGERVVRVPPKLMARAARASAAAASRTRSTPWRSPGPRSRRAPRPCPPPTSTSAPWS
jgi:transposase